MGALRYVAESYDRSTGTHFLSFIFTVAAANTPPTAVDDAHVVASAWTPCEDLANRLSVGVVREPLLTHLAHPHRRYFGYADAGITIEFADPA